MNKLFKIIIILSCFVITSILLMEAWRENLNMDWQKYQRKYKDELFHMAQTAQDRSNAGDFEIMLRQIVLPKLDRSDRCVTCHIAIEDSRMSHMQNPLKSHPGDYLDTHDVYVVGCTSCHDGQGRAITTEAAHGRGAKQFWEQPLLEGPFLESSCVRCHADTLQQTPNSNSGRVLFQQRGCFACHSIGDIGGVKGPALSDIGRASFHKKMPVPENRERLLSQFNGNVNLAYLFEAVTEPDAQPKDTLMKKMDLTEEEVTAILVYLKSLSAERRVMDVGVSETQVATSMTMPKISSAKSLSQVSGASAKGYVIFSRTCVACHTIGSGDRTGPDLKGVTSRRNGEWLKKLIQFPTQMTEEKDPIVMQLLEKYKTPMIDMGLTVEDVEEVIKYLKNPEAVVLDASAAKNGITSGNEKNAPKVTDNAAIRKGRVLFQGKQRFLQEGPSCIACHDVGNDSLLGGGRLAKELTTAYSRLGDIGMDAILKNQPFPLMREAYKDKPLTRDEISALVAFLEQAEKEQKDRPQKHYGSKMFFIGFAGFMVLLGFYGVFWFNRRNKPVNKDVYDRQTKSAKKL
ncbi:MAG: hypothetical protein A3G33_11055 [Omnitrophica bacterium RIFCSPLOWO2_12_FULL_44_17]|uniref:Cytochrome c domain-containing protein n=1 Tax=Candidatus Danuiimicrobium aquiferis TaxID=1801832 RepID=A0A1G1KT14_9BACT|nr:MAG: hypothetical protein A3B72_01235 [Omnitrophica bacterium RIFCSPHIGHO2_02_FULL_45_28]OGW91693.1 MAG: hypothetical protein A3E74_09725 [Omnitrophica bacterium RIFCSPHIGHO2_12_FULL_44_12]OGW96036.1 MAG: hypothetical protein A3G33_11055 [Omnitrophica bacterium RIFCSPLOWO2_12_FULL_44_17]